MFTPTNVPHQTHHFRHANDSQQSAVPFSSSSSHFMPSTAAWTAPSSVAGAGRWGQPQQQNNESLIRKHRSLEGVHQLLLLQQHDNNPSCSSAPQQQQLQHHQFADQVHHQQLAGFSRSSCSSSSAASLLLQPLFPAAADPSSYFSSGCYTHPTTTTTTTTTFNQPSSQYHHGLWAPSSSTAIAHCQQQQQDMMMNHRGENEGVTAPTAAEDVVDNCCSLSRIDDDGFQAAAHLYQPVSAHAILQQVDLDPRALRRELASLCDRFNYLTGTVRNFWAPELRRERLRWREQYRRANELEQRLGMITTETQMLNAELKANRRDDQQQFTGQPKPLRDFTETSYTMHEWQTLKAKLERSELSLADRTRAVGEAELRANGAEEQKAELERRNECLSRTLSANETQLKLLQEDLDMLRAKLETKNQLLDTRDRERKRMEADMEMSRAEVREQEHRAQEAERRVAQLTHQIDQLERDMRERDAQMERQRKRLQEPAAARAEQELHEKLDNALEDRKKLEQLVDQLRAHNDAERLQQLEQFKTDREHMEMSIQCLKKELADRHVLISSQNEKISQLNNAIAKQKQREESIEHDEIVGQSEKQRWSRECGSSSIGKVINTSGADQQQQQQLNELDMTRRDMDRLLERVRELEREKKQRQQRQAVTASTTADEQLQQQQDGPTATDSADDGAGGVTINGTMDEQTDALKHRIHELEEALRESVGITSEREKTLAEQKKLNQKLTDQVTELLEAGGGAVVTQHQRQLHEALNALADARNRLEEERLRNQRMVGTVRKELGMALVAEKEAAILLVQNCYGAAGAEGVVPPHSVRERLEQMHRQKERLRHALLHSSTTAPATAATGSGGGEKQLQQQQQDELLMISRALGVGGTTAAAPSAPSWSSPSSVAVIGQQQLQHQQQQFSQPISIQTRGTMGGCLGSVHGVHQQSQHPPLGISAPASLTYYGGGSAVGVVPGTTTTANGVHQHQQSVPDEFGGGGGASSLVDEEGIWA